MKNSGGEIHYVMGVALHKSGYYTYSSSLTQVAPFVLGNDNSNMGIDYDSIKHII